MAKSESDKKLTDKQEMFCMEYLKDLNATQAAIRAGYSLNTAGQIGEQNLKKLEIQRRVTELQQSRSERTQITADWVLNNIKEVAERCMQKAPVMIRVQKGMVQEQDEEGNNIWRFDASGALKGLELIGKHIGFFEVDNSQKADATFKIITETVTKKV